MGRYYHLSKRVTDAETEEILRELWKVENVESAEIIRDHTCLKVTVRNDHFPEVMGIAVNICRRAADGAELSFAGFA